jgi:subtilisin family serine protease
VKTRKAFGIVAVAIAAAAIATPISNANAAAPPGQGVVVYVVDTGVRADHVEFASNVRTGFSNVNDGRGTNDCNGHGTHTAALIAGKTYGKASSATIVPVRVFDCSGFAWTSNVVQGIEWAIEDHAAGPAVLNVSISGPLSGSLNAVIERAVADGIVVVAAAGNNGKDACNYSPGSASSAITVGAIDQSGARWEYSNSGKCVDVVAPGVSIVSAWYTSSTETKMLKGTSQAAPQISAVAASILSENPGMSVADVTSRIVGAAQPAPTTTTVAPTATVVPAVTTVAPAEMVTRSVAVPRSVATSKTPYTYNVWVSRGSESALVATGVVSGFQVTFQLTKDQLASWKVRVVFSVVR